MYIYQRSYVADIFIYYMSKLTLGVLMKSYYPITSSIYKYTIILIIIQSSNFLYSKILSAFWYSNNLFNKWKNVKYTIFVFGNDEIALFLF